LIADNSNISYNTTVEGYEMGQISSVNLPMSTEFMGCLRALGGILLRQDNASGDELTGIVIYTGLAQQEFSKLNLILDKIYAVNPELESVFKASRQEMEGKINEALKLVNEQIVNSKKFDYSYQQYFATLTSAIDAQFAFSRVVNKQLEISLNAQANRLETKKYTILTIVVLLFVLCVAVAMVVVRGILLQVRSVTQALESIAQGDLATRADMPHSSDEFVQIARSFDVMAAALQARQSETARRASPTSSIWRRTPSSAWTKTSASSSSTTVRSRFSVTRRQKCWGNLWTDCCQNATPWPIAGIFASSAQRRKLPAT